VLQRSIISSTAKSSLCAYFVEEGWPLNKALPRRAVFLSSPLGEIVAWHQLTKTQVHTGQ
jgi:hypothetical protein